MKHSRIASVKKFHYRMLLAWNFTFSWTSPIAACHVMLHCCLNVLGQLCDTEIHFPTSVTFCCLFLNCRVLHRNILSGMANSYEQFVLQSIMCNYTDFHFSCKFCSFRSVILMESWFLGIHIVSTVQFVQFQYTSLIISCFMCIILPLYFLFVSLIFDPMHCTGKL